MPQGDRTGPWGQGPRTGRSFGFCSGYNSPGFTKGFGGYGRGFGFGRGINLNIGRGRGFGRGWRFWNEFPGVEPDLTWTSAMNKEDEIKLLRSQADSLKRSQQIIDKRLSELEKEGE